MGKFWNKAKNSIKITDISLEEFIKISINSIVKGTKETDASLKKEKIGEIYLDNLTTMNDSCVTLGILKSDTSNGKSKPVIAVQFDVSIAVSTKKISGSNTKADLGANILNLVSFEGEISSGSTQARNNETIQRIKFTIPVMLEWEDSKQHNE